MAFKIIYVFALFAIANAGVLHDTVHVAQAYAAPFSYSDTAVGSTQEKVVRSFDGTVSHYSKSVDTPFSSVRKTDTRVNNKVYSPINYHAAVPVTSTTYHVPAVDPVNYHAASVAYHNSPVGESVAHTPVAYASSQPITYAHQVPVGAAYQTRTLSFSPAAAVSHVSFAGLGAHYEW